jgi:phage gp36-like protein
MPAYVSQAQLVDRYGTALLRQLTDRATPPSGAIDAAVVTRAITDAGALIDGYLSGRYQLPMATVPIMLLPVASAIAIYLMHGQIVTEKIRLDYQDAIKTLSNIANGSMRLDVAGAEPAGKAVSGVPQTNAPARPIVNGPIGGFI